MGYYLGLDLGVRSLGWAVVQTSRFPPEVIAAGVRCFEAGVEGAIEQGKDASRAAERRQKRGARRQTWRKAWRLAKVFRALQRIGLLPAAACETPESRHLLLENLDDELRAELLTITDHHEEQVFLYRLRQRAVAGEALPPFAVGRAIYHLAQRRGFLSNRKAEAAESAKAEAEEVGRAKSTAKPRSSEVQDKPLSLRDVKGQIQALKKARGSQTLGSYFAQQNPLERRIRQRWLGREDVQQEFEAFWQAQAQDHPALMTTEARKAICRAIFFQRPLKSAKGLVGRCELEPKRRRAAQALLIAQRFRMLQMLNNVTVLLPGQSARKLTEVERNKLHDALEHSGDQSFAQCRTRLALPRGTKFNYEEGGDKRLVGNRTHAKLLAALGDRWEQLGANERDQLALEVLHYQKAEALRKRLRDHWQFTAAQADALAEITLEPGYSAHCRPVLERLTARMEASPWPTYSEARKQAYPESFLSGQVLDFLPPVNKAFADLRNPAVARALTELRKVVNNIVRRYGKPDIVRIELARDLKKSRKERKRAAERADENRKQREHAVWEILSGLPNQFRSEDDVRKSDITKVLLAKECNWRCPFTDEGFGMKELLGAEPKVDVAHIYPQRYLDDSFANLTLCQAEENRHRMRDELPYDAYSQDSKRWNQILDRVRRFEGPLARVKLRRFETQAVPEEFAARQLNDTRHASAKAADYLGLLFGGRADAEGKQRVFAVAGGVTSQVRQAWNLNRILGAGDWKNREDHRQHAVDAVVLALTGPNLVGELQRAAARELPRGDRLVLREVPLPRPDFVEHVAGKIRTILVSHRPDHRLGGPLHAETNYSPPIHVPADANNTANPSRQKAKPAKIRHHVRKALHKLTETEIKDGAIVDRLVRELVQAKYAELGGGKPAKVFADPTHHPSLPNRHGAPVPIHKVRVAAKKEPFPVGSQEKVRFVAAGDASNHHIEIVAKLDGRQNELRWAEYLVTRREAYRRKTAGEPVVKTDWGAKAQLVCSLFKHDYCEWTDDDGGRRIYRVINLSAGDIGFQRPEDGRLSTDIKKAKERIRQNVERMRKQAACKVLVTPLGEVIRLKKTLDRGPPADRQ